MVSESQGPPGHLQSVRCPAQGEAGEEQSQDGSVGNHFVWSLCAGSEKISLYSVLVSVLLTVPAVCSILTDLSSLLSIL